MEDRKELRGLIIELISLLAVTYERDERKIELDLDQHHTLADAMNTVAGKTIVRLRAAFEDAAGPLTMRDLTQISHSFRMQPPKVKNRILRMLADEGFIRERYSKPDGPGRPTIAYERTRRRHDEDLA